jgi:hypothetical protein
MLWMQCSESYLHRLQMPAGCSWRRGSMEDFARWWLLCVSPCKHFRTVLLADHASHVKFCEWVQPHVQILSDILFTSGHRRSPSGTVQTTQGIPILWRCNITKYFSANNLIWNAGKLIRHVPYFIKVCLTAADSRKFIDTYLGDKLRTTLRSAFTFWKGSEGVLNS